MGQIDEDLITVAEIASRLGISRRAVFSHLQRGVIAGRKLGRRWLVLRKTIDRILVEAAGAPR